VKDLLRPEMRMKKKQGAGERRQITATVVELPVAV